MDEKKFVAVVITPFDEDVKLNCVGVSALIDFYCAAGVKSLLLIGRTAGWTA